MRRTPQWGEPAWCPGVRVGNYHLLNRAVVPPGNVRSLEALPCGAAWRRLLKEALLIVQGLPETQWRARCLPSRHAIR